MVSARTIGGIGLAVALVAAGAVAPRVNALPPGTPSSPGMFVAPGSGTDTTPITWGLTAPDDRCPGDTTTDGVRWSTFLASVFVDTATLTYNASGPIVPPGAPVGTVVQPLSSTGGVAQVSLSTVDTTGVIAPIIDVNLDANTGASGVSDGAYQLGIACVSPTGDTVRHWQALVTISGVTATSLDWSLGTVPGAPVLSGALTPGDGTLSGSFSASLSTPPQTGYQVTATPQGGGAATTLSTSTAGGFVITGLVNGTTYDVAVSATNSVGTGLSSNTVSGTPTLLPRPPVSSLSASPGTEQVVLGWTAPSGPAPIGYTIDVTPAVAGAPFSVGAASTSLLIPGLTGGSVYDFTITPLHTAPFVGAPRSSGPVAAFAQQIGTGGIEVLRPVGALVLTQRCGVYGALPEELPSAGFPAVPALPASVDQVGTAPSTDLGFADPVFAEYPYPAVPTYPTRCGVDMGTARLVTTGGFAGAYFAASGRLNQISVVDTRDVDPGFTVNGTVTDFVSGGQVFAGSLLGWSPVVTDDSDASFDGYDQLVIAGAVVGPGVASGLASARALAFAPAGRGLGIASLDARLKLLIPVTADAGTYTATVTITTI